MQDIFVAVCRAGKLADYTVQNAVVNIVLRCVSPFLDFAKHSYE
jgi:hypothetical protein